jgi:hypothetical protein
MRRSAALTWALVALVNLTAFLPRLLWPNPAAGSNLTHPMDRPRAIGVGYEVGLLVALVALSAGLRHRRAIRAVAVALFAAFLLFTVYHEVYLYVFFIDPAVVDDWRLVVNLAHFLRDAPASIWAMVVGGLLAFVGIVELAAWTLRRVQEGAATVPLRRRALAAVLFAVAGAIVVARPGAPKRSAVVQQLSDGILVNIAASRAALANWRAIFDHPPDTRYDALMRVRLTSRPNVYLFLFEAYGEILATCDTSKEAYRNLLDRIEQRLAASGLHARSAYSEAPIHGGRSWMSIATIQSGIRIDAQPVFRVFQENVSRLPTLTSFFKANGYHTMMLQPWDKVRVGLPADDIYRRDVAVTHRDIPYRGPPYGLTGIPDQYSVAFFDERYVRPSPQPRFVSYMATQTHYNWWPPPPFAKDWRALDRSVPPDQTEPWPPVAGVEHLTDQEWAWYFADVEYEWRVLLSFIESHRDEDALFIVIGDHQPFLKCGAAPVTLNTPLHLISRDTSLLDRFATAGLDPGLFGEPNRRRRLNHEGLFSMIVQTLANNPSVTATNPRGAPLSGLRR